MGLLRIGLGAVKMAAAVTASAWAACLVSATLDEAARRRREQEQAFWATHSPATAPRALREVEAELLRAEREGPPPI